MLFGITAQLIVPRLIGISVDTAIELSDAVTNIQRQELLLSLLPFAGLIIAASMARGGLAFVHSYIGESIGQQLAYRLRLNYFDKLQRLSFSYHDKTHTGDIITRGIVDIEAIRRFVNFGLLRTIFLIVILSGGAFLVISVHWQTGLIALSFIPFVALIAIRTRLKLRSQWLTVHKNLSELSTIMEENLSGTRVVRSFASQDYEMQKYDVKSKKVSASTRSMVFTRSYRLSLMNLIFLCSAGGVLGFGSLNLAQGNISVGDITTLISSMFVMQAPVQQLGMVINSYARASSTGKRIFEIIELDETIKSAPNALPIQLTDGILKFERVSFQYPSSTEPQRTLEDISFTASPTHSIGIMGAPGSGKSTIAHLIPRFYDVLSGKILVDGQDIREVSLNSLRKSVSIVEQDNFLFTTSIKNNVAYGDPWTSLDNIIESTKTAQIHSYIDGIDNGYSSVVGERGVSLSGGQRQRMAIARSLVLNPAIIVFDDSTSSIDARTEKRIRLALEDKMNYRTVIVISHRVSSVMHTDEIIVLDKGRIVERGSHNELLELNKVYRKLYNMQNNF